MACVYTFSIEHNVVAYMNRSLAKAYLFLSRVRALCGSDSYAMLTICSFLLIFIWIYPFIKNRVLFGYRQKIKSIIPPCCPVDLMPYRLVYGVVRSIGRVTLFHPLTKFNSKGAPYPQVDSVPSSESCVTYHVRDHAISTVSDPQASRAWCSLSIKFINGFLDQAIHHPETRWNPYPIREL